MKTRDDVLRHFDKDVCICDGTLDYGEMAAGVVFSNIEKYRIAQLLDNAGVSQIECGIPAMGGETKIAIKHIANMGLNASIMARSKGTAEDVKMSLDCDVDSLCLTMPTSDIMIQHKLKQNRAWVLEQIIDAITVAKEHGLYVSVKAEDATRTDLMFLIEFAKRAKDAGANRLCYCDSIGVEEPMKVFERIQSIRKIVGIEVEIHARNDFGMANAVTAMAIKADAKFASTTIMGIGERCGNAALEQVVMTCEKLLSRHTGVAPSKLRPLAELVSVASGYDIEPFKPFLGSNCFTFESGMHSATVLEENQNDEPYKPEEIGLQRKIVIGKHCSSKTITEVLRARGIDIRSDDADAVLLMVWRASDQLHRALTYEEVEFIYNQYIGNYDVFDDKQLE